MVRKMTYYICKNDELYHYGIKGMKWGVRKDSQRTGKSSSLRKQEKNGSLTDRGYSKYYTNGKINERGKKARKKAQYNQKTGGMPMSIASSLIRRYTIVGTKNVSKALHEKGNVTINAMRAQGASYNKRKAVAGAYIAAMGAVKMYEIAPIVKTVYSENMYKYNKSYKAKTDTLAKLSDSEKVQRKKK